MATNLNVALIVSAQDKASTTLKKIEKDAGSLANVVKDFKKDFAAAAIGVASFGAAVGLLRGAGRAVMEIEDGIVGIGKTTGLAGESLRSLGEDILNISRTTPIANRDLLAIAQTAGQLGIEGADNIRKFTETIAQLSVASDLQGEEGATILAKLFNVTGEEVGNVDRIAAAIVDLGNKSAATEAQIARFAGELARNAQGFGIQAVEFVGLGAAFAELGLRVEETSSVFGRTMRTLATAVNEGGAELDALATMFGTTGEALAKAFKADQLGTTLDFLAKLAPLGDRASVALELIGLSGDEINSVLPTLAMHIDTVNQRLHEGGSAYEENSAHIDEARIAAGKLSSQLDRLKAAAGQLANEIGGADSFLGQAMSEFARQTAWAFEKASDIIRDFGDETTATYALIGGHAKTFFAGIKNALGFGDPFRRGEMDALVEKIVQGNEKIAASAKKATDAARPAMDSAASDEAARKIEEMRKAIDAKAQADKDAKDAAREHARAMSEQQREAERAAEAIQRAADSIRDANERFRVAGLEESGAGILSLMAERETEALEILRRAGASEAEILETRRRIREEHGEKFLAILERQSAELDAIRAARPGVDIGSVERGMDDVFPSVDFDAVQDGLYIAPPQSFSDGIKQGIADVAEFNSAVNNGRRAAAAMAQTLGGGFSDALMQIATGSNKAGDAFKEFGKKVIQTLVEIAAKQAIVAAFSALIAVLTGGGSVVGGMFSGAASGALSAGGPGTSAMDMGFGSPSGGPAVSLAGLAPSAPPSVVNNYQINAIDTQSFAMAAAKSERETGIFSGLSRRASLQPGRG